MQRNTIIGTTIALLLIADACSRLPRNLTRLEWRQYLGDEPYRSTCPNLPVPEE
jgi:hypothetical protein